MARLVASPLVLEGLFDFNRLRSAPSGDAVHVDRGERKGMAIHDHVFPSEIVKDHEHWVDPAALQPVYEAGELMESSGDDVALGPTLELVVSQDARMSLEAVGAPSGRLPDTAFELSDHGSVRRVWAIDRHPDDDGISFILNGLPDPSRGSLVLTFTQPIRSEVYGRLEVSVEDGGRIAIEQDESGRVLLRAM